MCQDVDYVVRMCMCDQLAGLAKAVGRDVAAAQILPETLELVKDEDVSLAGPWLYDGLDAWVKPHGTSRELLSMKLVRRPLL